MRALFLSAAALGAASLVVLASRVALAPAGEREERLAELGTAAVLPTFTVSMQTALSLTVALHPSSLDGALFQLDAAAFGGQPSFAVGALFRAVPALRAVCTCVYLCLPFAFAFVLLTPTRAGAPGSRADLLESFFAAGCAGFAVYHLVPALGPAFAFAGDFPLHAPPLSGVTARLSPPSLAPRNAVPSLHTAWALLLVWHARGRGAFARYASIAWLVLTVAATQGLGEHYLVDVVIAVPFAVALDALATRCVPIERRERALPAVAGIALVACWIVLARSEAARQAVPRVALGLFVLVTLVAPLALRRSLLQAPEREAPPPDAEGASPRELGVRALVAGTGVVGAAVVLLLDRALLVAVGGDARLSAVEVFAGLSGLGLGAWIGGRVAARRDDPARLHAAATIALGVYGALAPVLAVAVRGAFVERASAGDSWLRMEVVRVVIVGCAVVPPAVAAGAALPFAARASAAASWLPAALTLGAAGGWIGAGDLVLPALGLRGAAALTLALALVVALLGLRLARSPAGASREGASAPLERALVAGAGLLGGGLTVAFAHLLAITAGEGPYAVPSDLAAACLGLAAGAALAALRPPRPIRAGGRGHPRRRPRRRRRARLRRRTGLPRLLRALRRRA